MEHDEADVQSCSMLLINIQSNCTCILLVLLLSYESGVSAQVQNFVKNPLNSL